MKKTDTSLITNKKIFIAPFNPPAIILHNNICKHTAIKSLGFLDNYKTDNSQIYSGDADKISYDYIIIAPSIYQKKIAEGLVLRGFDKNKILFSKDNYFTEVYRWNSNLEFFNAWIEILNRYLENFGQYIIRLLPQKNVTYFSESFIDSNLLEAFIYHDKTFPHSSAIKLFVKDCDVLPEELKQKKNVTASVLKGYFYLIFAKMIVIDHEISDPWFNFIRKTKSVSQLWHGLPVKFINNPKKNNFPDYKNFFSSSNWYNEKVFPEVFSSNHFYSFGYPRNDVFFQSRKERNNIGTIDLKRLEAIKHDGKLVMYMPTYRDNGSNNYPLDFQLLNDFCIDNDITFILKMHPFVTRQFVNENISEDNNAIVRIENYSNLYLYPSGYNVYPWLADTDILITDYSSVHLDFLLRDKPIIFYWYDLEEYTSNRGQFIVNLDEFSPGNKARDFNSLLKTIKENLADDNYAESRNKLLALLGMKKEESSPMIIKKLMK